MTDVDTHNHSFSVAIRIAWIPRRVPSVSVAEAR
jgi:hypothetical protein